MLDRLIEQRDRYKQDHAKAQQLIKDKETELAGLRQALLRLEGGIQVLDETIEEIRMKPQTGGDE